MNDTIEIKVIEAQANLLINAIDLLSPSKIGHTDLTEVIGLILTLNHVSLKSIILLYKNNHHRDMIILTRPFLESIINVGYICAKGSDAVLASKKYAYQKGFRDLFREIEINGFNVRSNLKNYVSEFEKAMPANMTLALQDFTSKKGKEIMEWTEDNNKTKVEVIGKRFGTKVNGLLTFSFFTIYRDVSEIIHNSYYGARIFLGMQQKDITQFKSIDEAAKYFGDHQESLAQLHLQQISLAINALLDILKQTFNGKEFEEILKKSNNEIEILLNS